MGIDLYTVNAAHAQCQYLAMHCGVDSFVNTSCTLKYTQSKQCWSVCFSSEVILTPGNTVEHFTITM